MPIVKKEVEQLKESLEEIRLELKQNFDTDMQFAEYGPKPSSLFEHFVLYNSVLAIEPKQFWLSALSRGDFRSVGWLPVPGVKSYRTVWRMGETIKPSISVRNRLELNFWFDRALVENLRPDIVVRQGHFEMCGEASEHVQLLKDGEIVAEFSNKPLEEINGYLVQSQRMNWSSGEATCICFRAKNDFLHAPLIIECKSFGAKLGNPEEYAKHADDVVIVSPEKLYQPKRENIHLVRVSREFDNIELRSKLKPFLETLRN